MCTIQRLSTFAYLYRKPSARNRNTSWAVSTRFEEHALHEKIEATSLVISTFSMNGKENVTGNEDLRVPLVYG